MRALRVSSLLPSSGQATEVDAIGLQSEHSGPRLQRVVPPPKGPVVRRSLAMKALWLLVQVKAELAFSLYLCIFFSFFFSESIQMVRKEEMSAYCGESRCVVRNSLRVERWLSQ